MRKERRVSVLSGEAGRDKEKTSRRRERVHLPVAIAQEVSMMYCESLL